MNKMWQGFSIAMQKEFEMFILGELSFSLGLHICKFDQGIINSQTKYVKEMLNNFKMEDCAPITTPLVGCCKLSKNDESLEENKKMYELIIIILLYAITSMHCITKET